MQNGFAVLSIVAADMEPFFVACGGWLLRRPGLGAEFDTTEMRHRTMPITA